MEWALVIARLQHEASKRYMEVGEGKYDLQTAHDVTTAAEVLSALASALLAGLKCE